VNPNLFAVNLEDLTVWYEFEGDTRNMVPNELIMTQVPETGSIGTFTYLAPNPGQPVQPLSRHVRLNNIANPMTKYFSTPLGHDVPLSIVAWVRAFGVDAYTLFGVGGSVGSPNAMGIQISIATCGTSCEYMTGKRNIEARVNLGSLWTLTQNTQSMQVPHNTFFHFACTGT